jgi:hypothetical protein
MVGALVVLVVLASGAVNASASARRAGGELKSSGQGSGSSAVTVISVLPCSTSYGAGNGSGPFVARGLPAATTVHGLEFYSNGLLTVLGPAGWACSALVAADGGQKLDVYPPGKPDYSTHSIPKGASAVEIDGEYTGHLPGAGSVCGFFPHSAAAKDEKNGGFTCGLPANEKTTSLTSDIVRFTDPAGVAGNGAGSGGSLASVGAVVYPLLPGASDASVNVELVSCTLPKKSTSLCSAIVNDFLVRYPPSYFGSQG